jgi:hypothetical protein
MGSMDKKRARLAILNYIVASCKSMKYGDMPTCGGFDKNYFTPYHGFSGDIVPQTGDLVTPTVAPHSEWYLSWYVEYISKGDHFEDIHVLESIETGRLCNWSNIGLDILCREVVKNHPEWRWTDKQYEFKDRWFRACYKKRDAYMTLPVPPTFHDGGGVTLGTRKRFGLGSSYYKKFPNWKKVLIRDMLEFYDSTLSPLK